MTDTLHNPDLSGEDKLFTTKEAARYLRVSHRTMEDWRCKGCGPRFSKGGKRALYRKGDLDRFLAARTFGNTAEAKLALRQVQHPMPGRISEVVDDITF